MIELPKDAKGREIPLDVDALYDKNSKRVEVFRWNYVRVGNNNWTFNRLSEYPDVPHYPQDYYLTPPDSWENLEEDLDRAVEENNVCMYFSESGTCLDCAIRDASGGCSPKVLKHILDRIRNLSSDGE